MEAKTISTKRAAEDVGQQISKEFADYLVNGFKGKFPEETPSVFISRETIMQAIEGLDNVSGVRFMYGFESVNDAVSRLLLMIPCNNTSTHLAIPNSIILPQGYMAHNGTRVGFEKCWQLLYNHTARFSKYFPELTFNKIMRGTFIGVNSLLSLLETEGCTGIKFNFGYDDTMVEDSAKNRPVFEALNLWGEVLDLPVDFTQPCPSLCGFANIDRMEQFASLNVENHKNDINGLILNRNFRDEYLLKTEGNGPLVEMYYYVNPSINEKIATIEKVGQVFGNSYESQITAFNNLLADGNYENAKEVFENTIYGMMETYLFQ
jgi:hypothetical protein